MQICELLIKHGAKINKADSFDMSALHWAVSLNLVEIVRLLLGHRANCGLLDHKGQTPIERAINCASLELVRLFADSECGGAELKANFRHYLLAAIRNSDPDILW